MTPDTTNKCPNCKGEYFEIITTTQTLVHAPSMMVAGRDLGPVQNPNITTYHVKCISCKHFFDVKTQHGKYVK